jgi:asparagine synthase (glutamine-hydrolysing)
MCGIVGYFAPSGYDFKDSRVIIEKMTSSISHRGPDDFGYWFNFEDGIVFGHRRLSIIDLTNAGHQPMTSKNGRYILIFNGEIYNHLDIRKKLLKSGHQNWQSRTDTETLLVAIELWGLNRTLQELIGMFAFALWDTCNKVLTLARDRMGEKPLYYGWQNNVLLFGSELKSLLQHPSHLNQVNDLVMPLYLDRGYIPAPFSIWKNIFKLEPGTYICFSKFDDCDNNNQPVYFWSKKEIIKNCLGVNKFVDSDLAIEELHNLLINAVSSQLIADVPIGAFLSGGIDSSIIVAIMQRMCKVNTYTIGFSENEYNEAEYAKSVSKFLNTNHTEYFLTDSDAFDLIPSLPEIYDEPFGDSSSIPTILVSRLAKRDVTVILSGDGADEIFGGYDRYFKGQTGWNYIDIIPQYFRKSISNLLSFSSLSDILDKLNQIGFLKDNSFKNKIYLFKDLITTDSHSSFYKKMTSQTRGIFDSSSIHYPSSYSYQLDDLIHSFMAIDTNTYLPDDILVKVDRATMSTGLEARSPFLDHRIFEFAWKLPLSYKIKNNRGKIILRKILEKYLPTDLIERPKMGFAVPIDHWLRGPLRGWAEELLSPTSLKNIPILDEKSIKKIWNDHISGKHNWRDRIWILLMLLSWVKKQKG